MDASPADTATVCGGDTALDNNDLIVRLAAGDLRGHVAAATDRTPSAAPLELGAPEAGRIPVYLRAPGPLAAFSFALGAGEGPLHFVPAPGFTPSLLEEALPGVLAVAWLEGLQVPAGQLSASVTKH